MEEIYESKEQIPLFGHYLVRDVVLSELLGKNKENVLYWIGKSLARKYPLQSLDEVGDFFAKSGWGNLMLMKESKTEMTLELQSIYQPYKINPGYELEAGFLAEQHQLQTGYVTEAAVTVKKKRVIFSLKWDTKDKITINHREG